MALIRAFNGRMVKDYFKFHRPRNDWSEALQYSKQSIFYRNYRYYNVGNEIAIKKDVDVNVILKKKYRQIVIERMKNDPRNEKMKQFINNKSRRTTPKKLSLKLRPKQKSSAVLIPICKVNGELSVLFTLRSRFLSSHQGQVSFPGGNTSSKDKSPMDTALRECEEEIGFPRNNVEVWTTMMSVPSRDLSGIVTPVVGYLGDLNFESLKRNINEVDDIFSVKMDHFLLSQNQGYTRWDNQMVSPVYKNTKHRIWGMTATLMDYFLCHCYPDHYDAIYSSAILK